MVAVLGWVAQHEDVPAASPVATSSPPALPGVQAPPVVADIRPTFDIVRIDPQGNAVIAGRAAPNADVTIRDGEQVLGTVRADARGEWVFVPAESLPSGGRQLTLSARDATGRELTSADSVVLVVPERGQDVAGRPATTAAQQAPLAVVVPEGDAAASSPRVIQAPAVGAEGAPADTGGVRLDVVDYGSTGQVHFAGSAQPGSIVRLYVDDTPAGEATTDASGHWTFTPTAPIATGQHRLRIDQLGAGGRVAARVELPFLREAEDKLALQEGRIVVQPGQSLWQIARGTYGNGMRYTVIYQANRSQIRDPNLIYPGQTFDLPR